MKKSIRILSILMAFVMLLGSFSVMGSAYKDYKGTAIAGSYNDVDKPVFDLEQYASMALDEVDRMLAKEQLELDLYGLLYLDVTSINNTLISVEQFISTGDVLLDMLGDLKTLPTIVKPVEGDRRGTTQDTEIIYDLLDLVAGLRDIVYKYVKGDPNNPLDAGLISGLISDYMFNVRELAIGIVYEMTLEGDAAEFDYMDEMSLERVPAKYKGNTNGMLNLGQQLLVELVLGEWKMIDEELVNKCSVLMKGSYAWKDANGNDVSDEPITPESLETYDYYAWVHPKDWVTVGLGGARRVAKGTVPAADVGVVDITTTRTGYEFIEDLMRQAYNYLLVPVITRDTVNWLLELCGYSFVDNPRTVWSEEKQEWIDNEDYIPDYHGYIANEADLTKISELFYHEGLADGTIRMPKITVTPGSTLVNDFNRILGEFAELIVVDTYTRDGVTLGWDWDYEGGNAKLFHNIAELGKFVVFVTDDLFFNKRSELPSAEDIANMDNDQQIVALVMREILNNSVDYIYIDNTYDTVADVAYKAVEQLAYQDIPQINYTKPVRSAYGSDEAYYEAVVNKMIDILFDIAVYNLNQGFDMNKANGNDPVDGAGLLQYQGDEGNYKTNLVQIAAWAFENYAAILPFDFNSDNGGDLTADQVWEDIDTIINALIPIKGNGAWISEEIAGKEYVSKAIIFDHILKPLYTLNATDFAKIFDKNESGTFATMSGVAIIVDLLDNVFDLLFPNVFQNKGTLDAVVQNDVLADMMYDLIGTLGASYFTNSAGTSVEGRGKYIAETALPVVCMILGLSDDQEFEEMEIYLPEILTEEKEEDENGVEKIIPPTFQIFNGSSGINTGYTKANGEFKQDNLYNYVIQTVNIFDYNEDGDNTGALTVSGIKAGDTISGGQNKTVTINGTLTPGNLVEFAVTYTVLGEDGESITAEKDANGNVINEIVLSKNMYAFVGNVAEDDDALETTLDAGNGRSINYEAVTYLGGGDDLDDFDSKMIRVADLDDDGKTTGTATVTGVTGAPFATINPEADQLSAALEGTGGTYFLTPFGTAVKGTDDEGNNIYYERFEYIYATDPETGETLYDEETGEPIIATDEAGNKLNNGGVEDGVYNVTASVNVAGTNVNVPLTIHLYDDFGLESAFERAVAANRQKSAYDISAGTGEASEIYDEYIDLLKDIAKFVLKPKKSSEFQADIAATAAGKAAGYKNKYEEYKVALDAKIEELEAYALNEGTGALKAAYNEKSGLNYEIRYDDQGYPYRYDYKYYEDEYVFFGMRDYVPHTYNRYKDARGRVADLINSQEVFVMAPFTDVDIYGEDYEASQEELDARAASIAAYEEAVENLGVIGSIESIYAIHMIELTGGRLIALDADKSKLEIVYGDCGNAIEAGKAYTEDSLEAYQHAKAFAEEVLGSNSATPSMVNTATTELVYAWKRLEETASYESLDAALNQYRAEYERLAPDAETQTEYTTESLNAFLDAYEAADNVDRDLGASDNEYLLNLAENIGKTYAALEKAQAAEPTVETSTEMFFADPTWIYMNYNPYLNEMDVMNLGVVTAADSTNIDAFLMLGNGVYSDTEIINSLIVTDGEIVVTPNEIGEYSTGSLVKILNSAGNLYKAYFVVIRGDVSGDFLFDDTDIGEIDMQANGMYEWFYNSYGTYDQYKAIAGDTTGDGLIETTDGEIISLAANTMGTYDMIYGGEMSV